MRGNPHASPGGIVIPTVVRADQAPILNAAAGKPRATVEAKIFPHAKSPVAPPEDKILSEKPRRPDFSCSRVRRLGNNVPIVK